MARHLCDEHPRWQHIETCLATCGFCGESLDGIASGECQVCGRIVCIECDAGYDASGEICQPCARGIPLPVQR